MRPGSAAAARSSATTTGTPVDSVRDERLQASPRPGRGRSTMRAVAGPHAGGRAGRAASNSRRACGRGRAPRHRRRSAATVRALPAGFDAHVRGRVERLARGAQARERRERVAGHERPPLVGVGAAAPASSSSGASSQTTWPASHSAQRLSGSMTAPPPVAMTAPGHGDRARAPRPPRSARKRASPSRLDDASPGVPPVRAADARVEVHERPPERSATSAADAALAAARTGRRGRSASGIDAVPDALTQRLRASPRRAPGTPSHSSRLAPRLAQEHARRRRVPARPRRAPRAPGASGSAGRPGRARRGPAAAAPPGPATRPRPCRRAWR